MWHHDIDEYMKIAAPPPHFIFMLHASFWEKLLLVFILLQYKFRQQRAVESTVVQSLR